jgi:hypothetical protein
MAIARLLPKPFTIAEIAAEIARALPRLKAAAL